MIAPTASAVASQMRKRTTATERNRGRGAINAYSSNLLKKLQRGDDLFLFNFVTLLTSISRRARGRLGCARRSPAHSLGFPTKNGVQFTSKQ